MKKMPKTVENAIQEFVRKVNNLLGDRVKRIVLYGSYARGEQNLSGEVSDIDIMILVKMSDEKIKVGDLFGC